MKLLRRCVVMVVLCGCLLPLLESATICTTTELVVPIFGQLILLGVVEEDVSRNISATYREETRIEYRCAIGYQPYNTVTNMTLTGAAAITRCIDSDWSLLNVECRVQDCGTPPSVESASLSFNTTSIGSLASYTCNTGYSLASSSSNDTDNGKAVCNEAGTWTHLPTCTVNRVIGNFEIVVIVASALGGLTILFIFTSIFFCLWVILLKHRYSKSGMEEAEVTLARAQKIYTLGNPLSVVKDEDSATGKPLYLTPDEMNALEHNSKHL